MNFFERKKHWENVFKTKDTTKVSWYQSIPETSLKLIENLHLKKNARIIEIGSGDSFLADFLLEKGYSDITLLDVSETALDTVKLRLKDKSSKITFLAEDVIDIPNTKQFDIWHDRAVFHFLTEPKEISKYVKNVSEKLVIGGFLILGTFSSLGPEMCSGLKIKQYSEKQLTKTFNTDFKKIECFTENHQTPSGSIQNFLFCVFQKI